jgi:AFG1-like ATPase
MMIDGFYDRHVKLIASAEAEPAVLYLGGGGRIALEFQRTSLKDKVAGSPGEEASTHKTHSNEECNLLMVYRERQSLGSAHRRALARYATALWQLELGPQRRQRARGARKK